MNLKRVTMAGILAIIIGGLLANPFYLFLKSLLPGQIKFIAFNPFDGFILLIYLGLFISGVLFSIFIIITLWLAYKDIFYKKEKEFLIKILAPGTVLFISGIIFGIFIYTKIMLPFFIETNLSLGLFNYWNIKEVLITGVGLSLILGLCFEIPILIKGLINFGLIDKVTLRSKRVLVIMAVLLFAGIITPTPDVLTQLIVSTPLYLLFELSIL